MLSDSETVMNTVCVCAAHYCLIQQTCVTVFVCFFVCFSGIRTEQDLYVRLIDSMTKQVR